MTDAPFMVGSLSVSLASGPESSRRHAVPVRVEIDPNVRVRGNATFSGFEEVAWDGRSGLVVGEPVVAYESESGCSAPGRITEIDYKNRLVFLSVEWDQFKPEAEHGEWGSQAVAYLGVARNESPLFVTLWGTPALQNSQSVKPHSEKWMVSA